ncbi:MAG: cytochrome c3 family protein [Thermodesulfobacteriota bacterium]
MVKFTDIIKAFVSGIARSRVSLVGAITTTVTFPILLVSALLDMQGVIENPYFGFVIYMVLGPLFITGLVLVFLGLFFFKGKEEVGIFTFDYLKEQFTAPDRFVKVRKLIVLATALTLANIFIIGLISYTGYHYTESVGFCGQFCHSVMAPEYTAYKNSPHSRVRCVECHIGPGAQWFVKSKISGMRQLVAVAFNTHSRPIETPVHGLRPARETCEACHRPEMFHGDKLYIRDKYLPDEKNTHLQTVLLLKVGSGGYRGSKANGIHWHVAPENKITYTHTDKAREQISEVTLAKPDGTQVVFSKEGAAGEGGHGEVRTMDCIDCHNRPTHIYLGPDEAMDQKILHGDIPVELPFIKKNGLELITREYQSHEEAKNSIATELRALYKKNHPELVNNNMPLLEKAIAGVQAAYTENVFPEMKIGWNTYRSFLGHRDESGCFRCHDDAHQSKAGETISMDCEACHIILAEDEKAPEILKTLRGK